MFRLYKYYLNKWIIWSLYLTLLIHIVILPLFEHPAVAEIPFWIPNLIEFICLRIYLYCVPNFDKWIFPSMSSM